MSEHRRKRNWDKVVAVLSCIVIAGTVGALTLPAITLSQTECGLEEHLHSPECFGEKKVLTCNAESLGIHQHTASCFDGEGNVICHYADFVIHEHDAACRDADGNLVCTLKEIKEHRHDDSCYQAGEEKIVDAGHKHSDECYQWVQGENLICGQGESDGHQHSDLCHSVESVLICADQDENHVHGGGCYEDQDTLICGQQESTGHQHTAECYEQVKGGLICTEQERDPVTEPGERVLICEEPEVKAHTHIWGTPGVGCYMDMGSRNWSCTELEINAHQHSDDCFATEQVLTCGKTEHQHTEDCVSDSEADVESTEDWEKILPEDEVLTGEWASDLLTVARSQEGYQESKKNFILDEEHNRRGYTRYGAWAGDPYSDWDALYVAFSLHYAGVPEEAVPQSAEPGAWVDAYREQEAYLSAEDGRAPAPGDLVFFDYAAEDGARDGTADHIAIVVELKTDSETGVTTLVTLEGDVNDAVAVVEHTLPDEDILGYANLAAARDFYDRHHPEKPGDPLESTGDGYTLRVTSTQGAVPERTQLQAGAVNPDSEEYAAYLAAVRKELDVEDLAAWIYDITLTADGNTVEPTGPVTVEMNFTNGLEVGEVSCFVVVHFLPDGTAEVLPVETTRDEAGKVLAFRHTQDSFSPTAYVALGKSNNPTEIGPNYLPVTYYVSIDNQWVAVGSTKTGWYAPEDVTDWENTHRDHVTLEQVASVLGPYGFRASGTTDAVNNQLYYQRKETRANDNCYNDTDAYQEGDYWFYPISRNSRPTAGYNIYYAPGKTTGDGGYFDDADLLQAGMPVESKFFSVKVFDGGGKLLNSAVTRAGGSFSFDASESGITSWLVGYEGGNTERIDNSVINLSNIRATVVVSPMPSGSVKNKTVTFKVMVDGKWETVGKAPYYFTGTFNGSQRAYITSTMAAQFLGDYGYTPTTDPGFHFGYSYDDIHNILYASNTNFSMDINGGVIADAQNIQLYTFNNSAAQTFRIWEAEAGYHYITPLSNSGYHVNAQGANMNNKTNIFLHSATDDASRWRLNWESDGRVSFWAKKNASCCIDVDSGIMADGTNVQLWNNGGNRYWRLNQIYRVSNQTVSQQNADGTYNIGLTAESNGDIVCYYLPEETSASISDKTEGEISQNNTFYSVSVRDDNQLIYDAAQTAAMRVIVPAGGEATITVEGYKSVLWGCNIPGVEPEENDDGTVTFSFSDIRQPVEVQATPANPTYTVLYYSNIPRYIMQNNEPGDKNNYMDIIDTSGGKLPQNTAVTRDGNRNITNPNQPLKWLRLQDTSQWCNQNNGQNNPLRQVMTTDVLTEIYSPEEYTFWEQPNLEYVNKLSGSTGYKLTWVGVLRDGAESNSNQVDDWWWYTVNDAGTNVSFTNIAQEEFAPRELDANGAGVWQPANRDYRILIKQGTVIVMWYSPRESKYTNNTTFYDYDITSGIQYDNYLATGVTGINAHENYMPSRNGNRNWSTSLNPAYTGAGTADVFAFGNQNCETGLGGAQWDGNAINSYNGGTLDGSGDKKGKDVYAGCTFGLVTGLDNGKLRWTDWITAPRIFNEPGTANGKYTYPGGSLTFNRTGDMYTLTAANSTVGSRDNLEYLFHPAPYSGVNHTHINTNNFWPMDNATNRKDPNLGQTDGQEHTYNYWANGFYDDLQKVGGNRNQVYFPESDDGRAHNWFFGMNFSLEFTLTADYIGPLEYLFFGDDDMWVFLDNQLICDIGGVHSTVGEYVNLWDYVQKGDTKTHTLTFFYTERGASGSTCWMSFILPSVATKPVSRKVGGLEIGKKVTDQAGQEISLDETYEFQVDLKNSDAEDAEDLKGYYTYVITQKDGTEAGGVLQPGGIIKLKANETATITGLPAGAYYKVTEKTTSGYLTSVNGESGCIAGGTIQENVVTKANYVNQIYVHLPSTGGTGTIVYTFSGLALICAAALMYSKQRGKRKGAH